MKIATKIFLAISIPCLTSILVIQAIQRHQFQSNFRHYTQQAYLERLAPILDALQTNYLEHGSWQDQKGRSAIHLDYEALGKTIRDNGHNKFLNRQLERQPPQRIFKRLFSKITLLDAQKTRLAGPTQNDDALTTELYNGHNIIGYLQIPPPKHLERRLDREFSKRHGSTTLTSSLIVIFFASLSAWWLSRQLGKPIKHLSFGVKRLSNGDYSEPLDIKRRDELGQLAKDVNRLSHALDASRNHQRQWISDISHELRTPVTVLTGEIECLEDGHTPLTLDAIASLKHETRRLSHLIDDLHQLSQADSGQLHLKLHKVNICQLLRDVSAHYQSQFAEQGLELNTSLPTFTFVQADSFRLEQVFNNLLTNSLRYTDAPGHLSISATRSQTNITVRFADSAPGVEKIHLDAIFQRLYRTDPSRSRQTGASGLGLAICRGIIEAHGGKIIAKESDSGGIAIEITLPLASDQETIMSEMTDE